MQKFYENFWTIPKPDAGSFVEEMQKYIKKHIANGNLKPNDLIPPYRNLAKWHDIHRNTARYTYQQLQRKGWLYARRGVGTFISETFPGYEKLYHPARIIGGLPIKLKVSENFLSNTMLPAPSFTTVGFDTPSPHYFPLWHHKKYMDKHVKNYMRINQTERMHDLQGLEFKDAIYRHLDVIRRFSIKLECVDIIMGRQRSLEKVLKTLLQPGEQVINTSPKDPMLREILNECGAICYDLNYFEPDFIEKLSSILIHKKIKVLILRPQCSYPESHHLKAEDCQTLIDLAKKHGLYIIEEDDYHEFWDGEEAFKELIKYDHHGHVIYIGVLSMLTTYMQQTRTIVASTEFIEQMKLIPQLEFSHRDILEEKIITDLLNSKQIYKYIDVMKNDKVRHLDEIWMEMDNYLRLSVNIVKPCSGLSLWLNFSSDVALQQAMAYLVDENLTIPYHPDSAKPGPGVKDMRLCFGTWDILEAQNGAKLLQKKLQADDSAILGRASPF